nr:PREDICTED: uncharacterized protein LOC103312885 [Tribolium castaneum]|eukprot:XP_015840194.1 PREDICTED: uncharacterized protein LOC103312885 [Tribolium castaneum]
MTAAQDVFTLKCILNNIKIRLCSRIESGVKQLLALITSDNDVVLHYTYGELSPVIKRVPWLSDSNKVIQAICFDPTATWLLVVSIDGSLYIIPALSLTDKKQKIDCKWSLNDVTHFPKHSQTPDSKPTCVVWWQTLDCNQNALVGYESGAIALISLTDGRCLGCCAISEAVTRLSLCQDNTLDSVSLLINGESGQQWRLVLEQNSVGCLWPPESTNQSDDLTRSRLYNLKQMGVDKLASLKQRLVEARGGRRDSQSDTASESSHSESTHSGPELLPCLCDTIFAPQYARNRYLFSAFYKPTSLLTVHGVDVDSAPLFVHKLMTGTSTLLLTDKLIYTVNDERNVVSVISNQLSECRMEGDAKFNSDALVAQFTIEKETILNIYKLTDLSWGRVRKSKEDQRREKHYEMPKTVDDLNIKKPRVDTCVVITNSSVYKVVISCSPINKFVHLVTVDNDLEKAERLSIIFGLNIQQLLEGCGDLMITKGSFHSGIILYKQAKVHLLKRVLKLAISADCRTLLKFVHLCLSASRVDMSMATKIHIGNLAVMAYTELILRHGGQARISNTKDFMNFLRYEEFYDQILAVNVACQAGHWNIVSLLAKCRGLQLEVVTAFGQILQSARSPRPNDREFLFALSEPSLTQSLVVLPQSSKEIFNFVRNNVDTFPVDILQRFVVQLDPSQPCVIPLVNRIFSTNKYSSSLDTTIESVDLENPDKGVIAVKDLIETFLFVLIKLIGKTDKDEYNIHLLDFMDPPEPPIEETLIDKMPDLHHLSCGFEHAAVVRNSCLYTMGVSSSGCLGLGPLLTQSSPPKLVQTLFDLKVKVLSVSCGRKHTLALTDYGVYAWGSNTYGQLGLGPLIQESPYPQIITNLAFKKMVQVSAGQYHTIALSSSGEVYTWGWGIHGQLGHGDCDNIYYPKLLPFQHKVVQVAAGHAHSLILTREGKLFGFGSNVFGQLEYCQLDSNKSTRPVLILIMPDIYTPIEKIATGYFHNIAVRADQEVYTWGASPQEVRILQSKNLQKQNGLSLKGPDSWKASVHIYSGGNKKPIEQVVVGYRHSVILHNGKLLWGKNKDDELSPPKLNDKDNISFFAHKFIHVSCGLDYTMAIDHAGKLLAWGSPSMAQTILGRSLDEDNKAASEGKVIVFKNTRRVIKFPNNFDGNTDNFPVEVPGLPTMAITFNPTDHRSLFVKKYVPYAVLQIENDHDFEQTCKPPTKNTSPLNFIQNIPKFKFGQKTLHYALETYHGFYDSENVMSKCLDMNNYQGASKIAMLNGHFGDSLGFQLTAFKKYMDSCDLDLDSIFVNKEQFDNIKEKEQDFVEFVVKNIQEDFGENSSLDSIRQWGDEVEHQGGRESPCEMSDIGDIRQSMSHYVQSLKSSDNSPPITSVSKRVSESDSLKKKAEFIDLEIKDQETREVIENASKLIEFYIRKIYVSENHILMQNVLMKCIDFWLSNNLPVPILENVLLKNMDKYFYPLSILLFCKNFTNGLDDEIIKEKGDSAGFLKEFSTKFCLHLCSMVLENVNKA